MVVLALLSRPNDLICSIDHVLGVFSDLLLLWLLDVRGSIALRRRHREVVLPEAARLPVESRLTLSFLFVVIRFIIYGRRIIVIYGNNAWIHLKYLVLFRFLDVLRRGRPLNCLEK